MNAHGLSTSMSSGSVLWDAGLEDDLRSVQRFLYYGIARGEDMRLYTWPLEETFKRPAITIRAIPGTTREADISRRPLRSSSYEMQHQLQVTVYHLDRERTVDWGWRVFRLLRDGENGKPLSIPLWSIALSAVVARSLRVLRPSLAMGVEATDDEGKWSVPISMSVTSPRLRPTSDLPKIERVTTALNP